MHSFRIDITADRYTITGCGVQIRVYCLEHEPFNPNPKKLTLYAGHRGGQLAFETDFVPGNQEDVARALRWYARLLNNPEMEFRSADPRQPVN